MRNLYLNLNQMTAISTQGELISAAMKDLQKHGHGRLAQELFTLYDESARLHIKNEIHAESGLNRLKDAAHHVTDKMLKTGLGNLHKQTLLLGSQKPAPNRPKLTP